MRKHFLIIVVFWLVLEVAKTEPITTIVGIGSGILASALLTNYQKIKCMYFECCDDEWIPGNTINLKSVLNEKIYGQHLVVDTVVRSIRAHWNNPSPQKALTISFHGWTGSGKNYVSKFIAENLYKRGLKSDFVHFFISSLHFPHSKDVSTYKSDIQNWIKGNVTRCERSLFIFDELDKMDPGVVDAIKAFIDHHREIKGINYSKSIFLFLSNTGGNDITNAALEHWKLGGSRKDLQLKHMEQLINVAAFNEEGGLHFSNLISSHLIDHFVPFLPLEKEHIRLCIRDQFRWKNISDPSEEQIQNVLEMLQFYPKGIGVFSTSGCKRVAQKVELILAEEAEEEEEDMRDEL